MIDPTHLFVGLVFGSIGLGYLVYGKRQKHKIALYCGLGMIVVPYFVTTIPWMVIAGLVLMVVPRFYRL